jgi:hypothetical protein
MKSLYFMLSVVLMSLSTMTTLRVCRHARQRIRGGAVVDQSESPLQETM